MKAHFLLGSHDILVAWTEYLIYLGHRLRAVSHCTYGLHTASLEDMANSGYACSDENGRVDLALTIWRSAEYNLAASGNLGRSGEHKYSAEQWCRSARNVESNLVYRHALLPAGDTGLRVDLMSDKHLRLMESLDIVVGKLDGGFQLGIYKRLSLVHFGLANSQCVELNVVEFQFIFLYSLVAPCLDVIKH